MTNYAFVPNDFNDPSQDTPRFTPYPSNHAITRGRYITSNDPRGFVPVYEYSLNNQWIMMDTDDGYVLWTSICKALGKSKADIVKMLDSQPDLGPKLRRVKGGFLKIQGTWIPRDAAEALARKIAWPIRDDLVPIFGPDFPSTCLSPDDPAYGQIANPRRGGGRRRASHPTPAASSASAQPSPPRLVSPSIPINSAHNDALPGQSHVPQIGTRDGLNVQQPNVISHTQSPYQHPQSVGTPQHPYPYYASLPAGSPSPGTHHTDSDQAAYRQHHRPEALGYNPSNFHPGHLPQHAQTYPYHTTSQTSSPSQPDTHTPMSEPRNPYQDLRSTPVDQQPPTNPGSSYQYNQYESSSYHQERQPSGYYYPSPTHPTSQASDLYRQSYQSPPYSVQQGFQMYPSHPGTGPYPQYSAERDQGEGMRRRGSGYEDYNMYGRDEGRSYSQHFGHGQGHEAPQTGYGPGYDQVGGYHQQPQQTTSGSQSPGPSTASPIPEGNLQGQHHLYGRDQQQYGYRRS